MVKLCRPSIKEGGETTNQNINVTITTNINTPKLYSLANPGNITRDCTIVIMIQGAVKGVEV